MLSLVELKKYYVNMYSEIRNYLWDFNTVECLAELEIALYRQFPDITELRNKFNRLYQRIRAVNLEDEYLDGALENFKNIIYSSDEFYSRIVTPREV